MSNPKCIVITDKIKDLTKKVLNKAPLLLQEDNDTNVIKGNLGVNKEQLIHLLGSTMYKGAVAEVAIKELVQNAFDAIKIAQAQNNIENPEITVSFNTEKRQIIVSDNGIGMTPEIVQKAFFTIGGSYKGDNVDNRLKSGGLGLAKMAFLFSSEEIEVNTVRNGIKTHVLTTPEQIQNDNFNIESSNSNESNGTTVRITIPEYYVDDKGDNQRIWFSTNLSFLKKPLIGKFKLKTIIDGKVTSIDDKNNIPEGYTSIGTATSDFGDIDIYVKPINNPKYEHANLEVLISGLFQFSKYIGYRPNIARFDTIIDIKPKVNVQNQLYPINNQREDFRSTVEPEIEDLKFLLHKINTNLTLKSIKDSFNRTISMDINEVSTHERETFKNDIALNIKTTVEDIFKVNKDKNNNNNENSKNILNVTSFREERIEKEKNRFSSFDSSNVNKGEEKTLVIDTSNLDISKPIFHNNTTMKIEKDGQDVLTSLGSLLLELKDLFIQTYRDNNGILDYSGIQIIKFIENQYWGFSFDKNYGGVNVHKKVFPLLAINPFYKVPVYEGVDSALALTEYITHLIIHEFNHNYARSENAKFTGIFPNTYAQFAGIGTLFNMDWKNKLYKLIKDNLNTFIKYERLYNISENLGESFEGHKLTSTEKSTQSSFARNDENISEQSGNSQNVPNLSEVLKSKALNIQQDNEKIETNYSEEEQSILNNTKRDSLGRLLAPNGKPSKLTEELYIYVRTKAFKDWFGDWENNPQEASKVVDENGEPLVVYHGGAPNITTFKTGSQVEQNNTGLGFYTDKQTNEKIDTDSTDTIFFSSNKYTAESYAAHSGDNKLNYYNEDGTLKDTDYTKVRPVQQPQTNEQTDKIIQERINTLTKEDGTLPTSEEVIDSFKNDKAKAEQKPPINSEDKVFNDQVNVDISEEDSKILRTFKTIQERDDRVSLLCKFFNNIATRLYNAQDNRLLKRNYFIAKNINSILQQLEEYIDMPLEQCNKLWGEKGNLMYNVFQQIKNNKSILFEEMFSKLQYLENIYIQPVEIGNDNDSEESEYNYKDGWMIRARELSVEEILSERVRRFLSNIKKYDKDGNVETDDTGFVIRTYSPQYIINKLINVTSELYSSVEFDSALKELSKTDSWVNQIIDYLQKKDLDNQLKHLLWHNLRKEKNNYWVELPEGKFENLTKKATTDSKLEYWKSTINSGIILNSTYSIYNKDNTKNVAGIKLGQELLNSYVKNYLDNPMQFFRKESLSEYEVKMLNDINTLLKGIGIDSTFNDLLDAISSIEDLKTIVTNINSIYDKVLKTKTDTVDFIKECKSQYRNIASLYSYISNSDSVMSIRERGKTYQIFSPVSYLGKLLNGIKSTRRITTKDGTQIPIWKYVINKEYAQYKQFFNNAKKDFNSEWLRLLSSLQSNYWRNTIERKIILHKDGDTFNSILNQDHLESIISNYWSTNNPGLAWYQIPLYSDKESYEFLKFKAYNDDNFKNILTPLFVEEILNEFERIRVVKERAKLNIEKIDNYDEENPSFKFFIALNDYIVPTEILDKYNLPYHKYSKTNLPTPFNSEVKEPTITFLDVLEYLEDYHNNSISTRDNFIKDIFEITFNKQFEEDFINSITLKEANNPNYSKSNLEKFYWNNAYAFIQIVRLTTTDLAFFKSKNNIVDFQKRNAELYGMTSRLYTDNIDEKFTVLILKDEIVKSKVFKEISDILGTSKDLKKYEDINVADAQGFRTLNSYKKLLQSAGLFTGDIKNAIDNILQGTYTNDDITITFETLKPFTYSQRSLPSHIQDYGNLKVPIHLKNSESPLLAIYGAISASDSKNTWLKTLNQYMVNNNIDVVNFESAVKVGGIGKIDITEDTINTYMNEHNVPFEVAMNNLLDSRVKLENGDYNKEVIQNVDYEDCGIQVSTLKEHLLDHDDIIASQFKKLIDSDLSADFQCEINGVIYDRNRIHNLIQELLCSNIIEGFEEAKELFKDNETLSKELLKLMDKSTRYTIDNKNSVKLNSNKDFNIPLFDPVQFNKMFPLLSSIIIKKALKQTIRRATLVERSGIGYSDKLNIVFKDSNDTFLISEDEWNTNTLSSYKLQDFKNKDKSIKEAKDVINPLKESYKSYEDYRNSRKETRVMGWECAMPVYSKELLKSITDEDGNIDYSKIPDNLKECIGLRTPSEGKMSFQNLYIKEWLPQTNGSLIVLPYEITQTAGSDFDIDKMFVYLPEFNIIKYDYKRAYEDFKKYSKVSQALVDAVFTPINTTQDTYENDNIESGIVTLEHFQNIKDSKDSKKKEEKELFKQWLSQHKESYLLDTPIISKIKYKYNQPALNQDKKARNNAFIDASRAILSSAEVASQVLSTQGFDNVTTIARQCDFLDIMTKENYLSFEDWEKLTQDEANKLLQKYKKPLNPLSPLTQVSLHNQNAQGKKVLGMKAVSNSAHAENQWCKFIMDPLTFLGTTYTEIDSITDKKGKLLSDIPRSLLGASADNTKDPTLSSINLTDKTAKYESFLSSLGVPLLHTSLFLKCLNISAPTNINRVSTKETLNSAKDLYTLLYLYNNKQFTEEFTTLFTKFINTKKQLQNYVNDYNEICLLTRSDVADNSGSASLGDLLFTVIKYKKYYESIKDRNRVIYTNAINLIDVLDTNNYENLTNMLNHNYPLISVSAKCSTFGLFNILKPYIPYLDERFLNLLFDENKGLHKYIKFSNYSRENASKLLDRFVNDYLLYKLSGSNFYDNFSYEDYIIKFPNYFKSLQDKYKNIFETNRFLKQLKVVEQNDNNLLSKIVFYNVGKVNNITNDVLTKEWANLLFIEDNPEIKNLAIQLFKYFTYYGLSYNGVTPIHLTPNIIKSSIVDYNNSLNDIANVKDTDYNFIAQFIQNNYKLLHYSTISKEDINNIKLSTDRETFITSSYKEPFIKVQTNNGVDYYYKLYIENPTNSMGNIYKKFDILSVEGSKEYHYDTTPLSNNLNFIKSQLNTISEIASKEFRDNITSIADNEENNNNDKQFADKEEVITREFNNNYDFEVDLSDFDNRVLKDDEGNTICM